MKKSGRENLSGTFNLQYNYKNKLRFQNNASFTQNKSEDTPYGSFSTYAVLNPYESMYDEDGLLAVQIGDRPNPFRDGEIGTFFDFQLPPIHQQYLFGMDHYRRVKVARKIGHYRKE